MKIIALDSSGMAASAAVWEDGLLRAEYTVNYKRTHSQTLLPMLARLTEDLELNLDTVDAVAVASGPGSFTGLRIGSATAKGLGLALGKPLVEVPTLEGLAYNLWGVRDLICPMLDARRNQVYTGIYEFAAAGTQEGSLFEGMELPPGAGSDRGFSPEERKLRTVWEQRAADVEEVLERLNALGRAVVFLGDGAAVYRDAISRLARVPYSFAPAHSAVQRAASVAALGAVYFAEGMTVAADRHQPEYLRKSQAQENAHRI